MTTFDDYHRAVQALKTAIVDADHAEIGAQRAQKTAAEQLEQRHRTEDDDLRKVVSAVSAEYAAAATSLTAGHAVGLQLPVKVRPTSTTMSLSDAVAAQRRAAKTLAVTLRDHESQVRGDADRVNAAAAALAARRAALLARPAPEPEAAEPPAVKARRTWKLPRLTLPPLGPLTDAGRAWRKMFLRIVVLSLVFPRPQTGFVILAVVTLGIALVLVIGRKQTLVRAPFLNLVRGRPVLMRLGQVEVEPIAAGGLAHVSTDRVGRPRGTRRSAPRGSKHREVIERATRPGIMTGFEPKALKTVPWPDTNLIHGDPGMGLDDSGFGQAQVQAGQAGEVGFAKALAKTGLLTRYVSLWSLHQLTADLQGKEDYDVDCVIITGSTIWLIDLKYYKSGDVTYRAEGDQLYCYDNATGHQIGEPRRMKKAMKIAVDRFGRKFQHYNFGLEARVVFVPTNNGAGQMEDVVWPGGVKAVWLQDFLPELEREPRYVEAGDGKTVRQILKGLLKDTY